VKTVQIIAAILFLFIHQNSFASEEVVSDGQQLYKTYCDACHGVAGGMDMSKRIAPPAAAVRLHYKGKLKDRQAFIAAVVSWLEKPDANKSLMRGAINRFKLMPPLVVAKEDAEKIAAYLYDGDLESPEGFEQHVKEMHGKKGMGKKGMGNNKTDQESP